MNVDHKDAGRGVFEKFTVERTDGRSDPGEKHEGCEHFVDREVLRDWLRRNVNYADSNEGMLIRSLRKFIHSLRAHPDSSQGERCGGR